MGIRQAGQPSSPPIPFRPPMPGITYDDFRKVEMHVGRVTRAEPHEASHSPSFLMEIDFGPELGTRRTSAQLAELYEPEDLVGEQVIAVTNFPDKQIADVMSEVLVLGVDSDGEGVVRLTPERDVPEGTRVY